MKHWREMLLAGSFILLFVSSVLAAVTIFSSYIGLGVNEDFFFYSLTGITRMSLLLQGFLGMAIGVLGVIVGTVGSRGYSWIQGGLLKYFPAPRIEAWLRGRSRAILIYFALPPKTPKYKFARSDQYFLLISSVIGAVIYTFKPIFFECDAAMYYNYANFLASVTNSGFSYTQPPGFPAFLILTGQTLFETFYGTIIAHAILGVLMPVIIYRILAPLSRSIALATGIAFILSTIPFYSITVMHATHLLLFGTILTFYFFSRYYFSQDPRFISLTIIVALLTMFTRWEGMFALILVISFLAIIARSKKQHLRLLVLSLGFVFLFFSIWAGARAVKYRDPSLLFALHSGSGQQLFWRTFLQLGSEVAKLEELFALETDFKKIEFQEFHGYRGVLLVLPENGPATAQLAKVLKEYVRENPESYRKLKAPLDLAYRPPSQESRDYYYEAFGRFDGEPDKLVNNMFLRPSDFHPNFIFEAVTSKLGISGSDQLLKAVSSEALWRHKLMVIPGLEDVLSFFGIDLQPILKALAKDKAPWRSPLFVHWENNLDFKVPFDIAGCMSRNLPENMFAELKDIAVRETSAVITGAFGIGHVLRNLIRNVAGPIFLLGAWMFLFLRHRLLFIPITITALALSGAYGLMGVGAYSRYEFPVQPLIILVVGGLIHFTCELFNFAKNRK